MRILHLYYDLMNLYGEYGNVAVLKKHLLDQGKEVIVDLKTINEEINFNDYDFIYCGSGTEKNQKIALEDLRKKQNSFIEAINNDKVILFTGNSMEMLGETIGNYKGLDIVPINSEETKDRYTGDVIMNNKEFGEIVGFINKCTKIDQIEELALFHYEFKDSNLVDNNYEGYRYRNLFGTHVIGPILVKNPNFMRYIIKLLVKDYKEISYPYEEDSYNVTLNALKQR